MKLFYLILCTSLLMSCGNSKNIKQDDQEETKKQVDLPKAKLGVLTQDWAKFRNTESYNIIDVNLQGNILQLDITYSGGCGEHEFDLIGSAFMMKSDPPRRTIKLYHHKNADDCREMISETLYFDVSDFSYQDKAITLQVEHFKQKPISYTKVVSKKDE